ncbi:MAG: OsmC family protein [Woeseiaceae bacterium]
MQHRYELTLTWTGNRGQGTESYANYSRDHVISAAGKPDLLGSADATYRGDARRWNPEELLLASLSSCHQLWFLHLCSDAGVVVTSYRDQPIGEMKTDATGSGQFTSVTLRPTVETRDSLPAQKLEALHDAAHDKCFIARSVNFPVGVETV